MILKLLRKIFLIFVFVDCIYDFNFLKRPIYFDFYFKSIIRELLLFFLISFVYILINIINFELEIFFNLLNVNEINFNNNLLVLWICLQKKTFTIIC